MRRAQGLTLLELMLAIFILVVVLGMASAGVVMALRAQSGQEAITSSQAKLRRVNEAVLQELRGAVLGGVTSYPVASGPNSVSFTVMDGGAGYAVQGYTNSQVTFIAAANSLAELDFDEGEVLLVNSDGIARVLRVGSPAEDAAAPNRFILNHAFCDDLFPFTDDILMFRIKTIGFSYDEAEKTLEQTIGAGDPLPLAYGISKFNVSYVYQKDDDTYKPKPTPYLDADTQPDRSGLDEDGDFLRLARLNISIGTTAPSFGGRRITREYTGQLELLNTVNDGRFRAVTGVSPCE